jgi:DNA-binding beta-propeller fold protein YncE
MLYVANSLDATVTRIGVPTGRTAGAALSAGTAPMQVLASPEGHLLVIPAPTSRGAAPTLVTPVAGSWSTRPLRLEPGARFALGAGGGNYALVAYDLRDAAAETSRCRLVVVDLRTGEVAPPRTVCAGQDSVVALALDPSSGDDPIAYLAIWRRPAPDGDCAPLAGNRIAAIRVRTGAVVAAEPLAGTPDQLAFAPATEWTGRHLYAVEAAPIPGNGLPDECRYMTHGKYVANAGRWDVLRLTPETLAVEGRSVLRERPYALAAAPGGDHLYALMPFAEVVHLDLANGTARLFATLPSMPLGIAVTDTRVYVSDSTGSVVRALDRSNGRVRQVIATGRHPTGLTLVSAGRR